MTEKETPSPSDETPETPETQDAPKEQPAAEETPVAETPAEAPAEKSEAKVKESKPIESYINSPKNPTISPGFYPGSRVLNHAVRRPAAKHTDGACLIPHGF